MLIGIMKSPVLYAIYKYDTDLFITIFCENKSRPQMKCNGKCYLAKMQKEQNEKDASDVLKQLQTETVYYNFISPVYVANNEFLFVEEPEKISYYNRPYSFLFTSHLVKPPQTAALS